MFDCAKHSFWNNIPDDCQKAINQLRRLKVFRLCGWDYEETFADVWWLVLHEVDLYEEGEFCREASRSLYSEGDPEAMNLKQAKAADKWLVRWNDLAYKYSTPNNFTEWHDNHVGFFGDGIMPYDGQLLDDEEV